MAKKSTVDTPSTTSSMTSTAASTSSRKIMSSYQQFTQELANLFPKVDQKLLLDIIHYETSYHDWEGSVMLKVIYPANEVDLNTKKEWIYKKYQRVPSLEGNRTLRFKAIRMYLVELEKLLTEDPQIEYITGSATLTPSDAYSS